MKPFKVVYRNPAGEPRATVCSYSEELANDLADEMEDSGTEILDLVEVRLGVPCEEIARMYK